MLFIPSEIVMGTHPAGLFCNRTLNLRGIAAVGYDMDYTLIHYFMEAWERRAYTYMREGLLRRGLPVGDLELDPEAAMRGLIIDRDLGNVVKADRFGYVKAAYHGTRPLPFSEKRRVYSREIVDLREPRWHFLNTMFSISEACMYMQLIDRMDQMPDGLGFDGLHDLVRRALDEVHGEGRLKQEILESPEQFVELDPSVPLTLLDQKESGKRILLITNSEWAYASAMLRFAFDPYLPASMSWRELFDVAFVGARKPSFFNSSNPAFEVVSDDGLLREHHGPLRQGAVYVGGNAALVEESLGLAGDEILYVGDHVFTDVNVSKSVLRWRTALVIRELEAELAAIEDFTEQQEELTDLMQEKARLESEQARGRLALQRARRNYGPAPDQSLADIGRRSAELERAIAKLDERITPLAIAAGALNHPRWGLLMRAGNDKSHMARQVERYADVYTSRVSNFLHWGPHAYLRGDRGSLPHDPTRA